MKESTIITENTVNAARSQRYLWHGYRNVLKEHGTVSLLINNNFMVMTGARIRNSEIVLRVSKRVLPNYGDIRSKPVSA